MGYSSTREDDDGGQPSADDDNWAVSTGARLVGDRWSLLIIREIHVGNDRFTGIINALPGLSRSSLSTRLRYLQHLGLVLPMTQNTGGRTVSCYALTSAGEALNPVLDALGQWARVWGTRMDATETNASVILSLLRGALDPARLPGGSIILQLRFEDSPERHAWLRANPHGVSTGLGLLMTEADLTVTATPTTFSELYWRRRKCSDAVARREIVFDGAPEHATRFPSWFPNRPAGAG